MNLTKKWIEKYKEKRELWIHDGNPKRPHVRLPKGNHSNGFFNSRLIMADPFLLVDAVEDLLWLLEEHGLGRRKTPSPERVVGPAMGAITLAHELASKITRRRYEATRFVPDIGMPEPKHCLAAFTEKEEANGMVVRMVFKSCDILPGEYVLLCEDVLTTGDSVGLADDAVIEAGSVTIPLVAVIVNRSGKKEIGNKEIVALVDHKMDDWSPETCPLCAQGSQALYPAKRADNWLRLNAVY